MKTVRELIRPFELCALCGRRADALGKFGLCSRCVAELTDLPGPFTVQIPVSNDTEQSPLTCLATVEYGGLAKRLVQAMKIRGHRRLARFCADVWLQRALEQIPTVPDSIPTVIVPVPASPRGRRRRGFDQSLQMARHLPIPTARILSRRTGRQQKSLTRQDRASNAQQRYTYRRIGHANVLPHTRVLLLDDVLTTGASLGRCAALLRNAGCSCDHAVVCVVKR
jgi:ComF family protein